MTEAWLELTIIYRRQLQLHLGCQMLPRGPCVRGLVSRVTLLGGDEAASRQGLGKSLDNWGFLAEGMMGLHPHPLLLLGHKGRVMSTKCFQPLSSRSPTWVLKETGLPNHGLEPLKPWANTSLLSSCVNYLRHSAKVIESSLIQTRNLCYKGNPLQDNEDDST